MYCNFEEPFYCNDETPPIQRLVVESCVELWTISTLIYAYKLDVNCSIMLLRNPGRSNASGGQEGVGPVNIAKAVASD